MTTIMNSPARFPTSRPVYQAATNSAILEESEFKSATSPDHHAVSAFQNSRSFDEPSPNCLAGPRSLPASIELQKMEVEEIVRVARLNQDLSTRCFR